MKKYKVLMSETEFYYTEVEAENEEQAMDLVREKNTTGAVDYYEASNSSDGFEVVEAEEIDEFTI